MTADNAIIAKPANHNDLYAMPLLLQRGLLVDGDFPGPAGIRIEGLNGLRRLGGVRSEVLRVDHAIVADEESHDTGVAIVGGRRDQCKSAQHLVSYHIVIAAALRVWPLLAQQPIQISAKGSRLGNTLT